MDSGTPVLMEEPTVDTREGTVAPHGEKMIELRIRFWTNDIAPVKGQILPKRAWSGGVVLMDRNEAHGIVPRDPAPFNNMSQLPDAIERCLIAHGVKLYAGGRDAKLYVAEAPPAKKK
jgi:hypothetical protein